MINDSGRCENDAVTKTVFGLWTDTALLSLTLIILFAHSADFSASSHRPGCRVPDKGKGKVQLMHFSGGVERGWKNRHNHKSTNKQQTGTISESRSTITTRTTGRSRRTFLQRRSAVTKRCLILSGYWALPRAQIFLPNRQTISGTTKTHLVPKTSECRIFMLHVCCGMSNRQLGSLKFCGSLLICDAKARLSQFDCAN